MIEMKQYEHYKEDEILDLYTSVGWSNYYQNPVMLKQAYCNSLFSLAAYDNEKLVGILRIVGDGHSIIYIQDILVLPDYQGRRIGTDLLKMILEKYKNVYQIHLGTDNTEKTVSFYKSLGFKEFSEINCVAFTK
ncbi:MAG: GNAT family N-acetyltransferase [Eubacteriales bacterium]